MSCRAGWRGCRRGWIRAGGSANGTVSGCCSPVTWNRRAPRRGRAALPAVRPRLAVRPAAARAAAVPVLAWGWRGRRSTRTLQRGFAGRLSAAAARCPAVPVICTAPDSVSDTNARGARTAPSRSPCSSPGPGHWSALPTAGLRDAVGKVSPVAGYVDSTASGCSISTRSAGSPTINWRTGSLPSGRGSARTSSRCPGCRTAARRGAICAAAT